MSLHALTVSRFLQKGLFNALETIHEIQALLFSTFLLRKLTLLENRLHQVILPVYVYSIYHFVHSINLLKCCTLISSFALMSGLFFPEAFQFLSHHAAVDDVYVYKSWQILKVAFESLIYY